MNRVANAMQDTLSPLVRREQRKKSLENRHPTADIPQLDRWRRRK